MDLKEGRIAIQAAEKSTLFLFPLTLYLIPAIYQLKRLSKMKQFIFYYILLIDNKIFLDSPFGSEKVVIGAAAIESSMLAAKVYFILCCSGSEDISLLSNTVAQLSSRKS